MTQKELDVAFAVLRRLADARVPGMFRSYITDDLLKDIAQTVVETVDDYRQGKKGA